MGRKAVLAASVLGASVAAVGLTPPAFATDEITQNAMGTYEARYPWAGGTTIWTATPCDDDADQCIHVTEFTSGDVEHKNPRWSANAYWSVGSWIIMSVDTPGALGCPDGTFHSLVLNYSWDAATNKGFRSYHDPGICSGQASDGANPFTLVKIGPPPAEGSP